MIHKSLPLFVILYFLSFQSFSQDFLGLSTGNYAGITGVSLQPASVVDSRHKFDINLFSSDINYSNNYFLLDRDLILKFNKNKFDNYTTFKDRYLSEATLGSGERVFFNINSRTQLPLSFMATTGKKSAIALNMQFRTMIQGRRLTQDFAKLAFNSFNPSAINPSINASGMSINSLSWAEAGFTYGRVLFSSGEHFVKAAVTAKYLAGLSSISLSADELQMRVNSDSTFNFSSPNVSYNHNRNADFNKIFDRNFSPDANAFGFDAGLVYEYRGNLDKFKYIKNDDERSYDALRRDVNKYIFKLGVSLLDVGMFQFDKPGDVSSFSANINNWDIKNAHYNSIKEFDTALASRVVANPNDPGFYNVYLPTALSAQLDVKFVKGLFLNVMSYWPVKLGSSPESRFNKYGFYTITPRFETRHFGIYIPYTITQRNDLTDYKQHLLGATVRLGPLFIGSSNLGSMLFNKKLRSADVHVGLKIGITYGKPDKSNRFINTIFKKNEEVTFTGENYPGEPEKIKVKKDTSQQKLIIDYKQGKIYDNPDRRQNIIIINNTYYNVAGQSKTDTTSIENSLSNYRADSLNALISEYSLRENKRIADSISKQATDSLKIKRKQLDSLIRSMQQLQIQMDSINRIEGNINRDSSVSFNPAGRAIVSDQGDSLENANEGLKTEPDEAIISNNSRSQLNDTVQLDTSLKATQSVALKKKDKSEPGAVISAKEADSLTIENFEQNVAGNDVIRDSVNIQKSQLADNEKMSQRLVDSLDMMSKRYAEITDSLRQKSNLNSISPDNAVLIDEQKNVPAIASMQQVPNQSNSSEIQRMQDQQYELLRQYSSQANSLRNDINRLNSRLSSSRNNERRSTNYIPVPIPIQNRRQRPVETITKNKTDTVYVRDTVNLNYIKDTIRLRDTIRLGNEVVQPMADTLTNLPVSEEPRPAKTVKEYIKEPGFDFTSMPEENILFAIGKSIVQPIYNSKLSFIAGILEKNRGLKVLITGHTDATGSRLINEKLSLERARAVAEYLKERGIPEEQIILKSQSFENPAVAGTSKAANTQNRRVALKLVK